MPSSKIVLIAGTEEAIDAARASLGDTYEYRIASSVEEAIAMIDQNLAVIACSVRFDESRMMDFVQRVRDDPVGCAIPVVCFRSLDRVLSPGLHCAIEQTIALFPKVTFVDLYAIQRGAGRDAALVAFREAVDASATDEGARLQKVFPSVPSRHE